MNDSTFYKFRDDIEILVDKIKLHSDFHSITETEKLKKLIVLAKNLLNNLETFQYHYEYDKSNVLKPDGFDWTDKNTKDNNWGRKDGN